MYGQGHHAAVLPATGAAGGMLAFAAWGLGILTVGLIILTIVGLMRRRKHARP